MPKNRLMYVGILVLVASVLLYAGAQLALHVAFILPYPGGVGVLLIVVAAFMELKAKKAGGEEGTDEEPEKGP